MDADAGVRRPSCPRPFALRTFHVLMCALRESHTLRAAFSFVHSCVCAACKGDMFAESMRCPLYKKKR